MKKVNISDEIYNWYESMKSEKVTTEDIINTVLLTEMLRLKKIEKKYEKNNIIKRFKH